MKRPVLAIAFVALFVGVACNKSADIAPWLGDWNGENRSITIKGTARSLTVEEDVMGDLTTYNGWLDDKGIHFKRDNKEFLLERVKGKEISDSDPMWETKEDCVMVRETGTQDAYCRD
jgi:hypothetical protein